MSTLSIDFETRSAADLKECGAYIYAKHPTTDVWCMAWAFDDEEPEIWVPSEELPQRVRDHIETGGEIRAWNAAFERRIWNEIMAKRYGAPEAAMEQFVCTMAEAAAMGLPQALGKAAEAMGLSQEKDDKGYRLMMQMARPRRIEPNGTIVWWNEPERLQRLYSYCKQDVRTEQAAAKGLRRLSPEEREMYLLTERMNDRGIRIDVPLVHAATKIVEEGTTRAARDLTKVTDGAVTEVTKTADLRRWLNEQGIEVDSVAKDKVAELLERDDLSLQVRAALTARAEAGKSSVAKLKTMLAAADPDDHRARGLIRYHGASTGRWTGSLVQPHNFARGSIKNIEQYIELVMVGAYEQIDLMHHPVEVVSSMLRSMMTAGPGYELISGDYSAIEARVVNWLAGQEDILDLFRRGVDVYKHNATVLYGIPMEEVQTFPHRQTGKFQELGCGFGMGWKKAIDAAKSTYGLDLDEATARAVVEGYRETHPKVKALWYAANDAALGAVASPGVQHSFGAPGRESTFLKAGSYLYLKLPSGRLLAYAQPMLEDTMTKYGHQVTSVVVSTVNSLTKKWERRSLYGGLIVENVTQAVARDIMAQAKLRAEKRGYLPILSVHDEVVVEVPIGFGSLEEYMEILKEPPAWAEGLPVDVEGWRGVRYRK